MVGVRGFEPPTSASQTLRASQLRYTPRQRVYQTDKLRSTAVTFRILISFHFASALYRLKQQKRCRKLPALFYSRHTIFFRGILLGLDQSYVSTLIVYLKAQNMHKNNIPGWKMKIPQTGLKKIR